MNRYMPLICMLFAVACSSGSEKLCDSGEFRDCTCLSGLEGQQTCQDDGSRWGECICTCVRDCTDRECGLDPVCGESCGECGADASCLESQCIIGTLTLVGWTTEALASVRVTVAGEDSTTTADDQGNFTLSINIGDTGDMVVMFAIGDQPGREFVELASILGDAGTLLERAGDDLQLTWQEHTGLHVTPVSTARYSALYAAGGDREPSSRVELIESEQWINGPLSTPLGGEIEHRLVKVQTLNLRLAEM